MLKLENISLIKNQKYILKNISWHVKNGEHWSILGLNGSGKTTLLNIITGYLWPTTGSVKVLGKVFGETSIPELRKQIGFVSSSLQRELHNDTVLSIILSGKFASIGLYHNVTQADIEKASYILKLMDCKHLQERYFDQLSQGEQQRVLIGRALMASPKILILDEPATGLDIIQKENFLQIIERLAMEPDAPVLIYVTHHVEEILPVFSHTLLLREGEVFQQGLTKDLLTEDTLSEFFKYPVSVQKENSRTWIALKKTTDKTGAI